MNVLAIDRSDFCEFHQECPTKERSLSPAIPVISKTVKPNIRRSEKLKN